MADLEKARIDELFDYSTETGRLYWKRRPLRDFQTESAWKRWSTIFAGKVAGGFHPENGYIVVTIDSKKYPTHRIIWTLLNGQPPADEIDHIDGDRGKNRPENMRDVDRGNNTKNRAIRSDNKSGVTGVVWSERDRRWYARININGKQTHIGTFRSIEEATKARKSAERQYGYHENHAKPDRPKYSKEARQ